MAYKSSKPLVTTHHEDGDVFLSLEIITGWTRSLAEHYAQQVANLFGFKTRFEMNGKTFSVSPE